MKILEYIVLFLLLSILGVLVYLLWLVWPSGESVSYEPYYYEVIENQTFSGAIQFYPNMRYKDKRISYYIEETCSNKRFNDAIYVFSLLSEKTLLEFYPSDRAQINVYCSRLSKSEGIDESHYIAGEGGPTKIINASNYYIMLEGEISIFRSESCEEPIIALHEILHALGFDHNDNPKSIMYPIANCEQKLDDYIIDEINRLYRVDSLPDIAIEKVNTSKVGRYLIFTIEISNRGIDDSSPVVLSVLADGQEVKEFMIGSIEIGTKKELDVQNLRIPKDTDKLTFVARLSGGKKELSQLNNIVEIMR